MSQILINKEIENGNIFISDFLNLKQNKYFVNPLDKNNVLEASDLLYHSDWNWLMRVIKKIESIREKTNFEFISEGYTVKIQSSGCTIESVLNNPELMPQKYNQTVWEKDKLTSTWIAVINFINWYKNQNK